MPRRSRIAISHLPHHVVQRGHNRRPVFITDKDRLTYLATLEEFRKVLGLRVYAYCLMTNHVHLIIDPGDDSANLGLLMKRLAGRHTRRINRLERKTGTSWEGRYKCSPIETDRYLLACSRYVDLNPVRANMVAHPADYAWSSYRTKVGLNTCDWLDLDPCYLGLGETLDRRQFRYQEWVKAGIHDSELKFLRHAVQRNQLTGSEKFILEVEGRTGERILHRGRGRPRSDD
ncbi:MAG: transposase [Steroidobacteraceae bacterium]